MKKVKGIDIGGKRAERCAERGKKLGNVPDEWKSTYWQPIGKGGKKRQKVAKIGNIGITEFGVILFA